MAPSLLAAHRQHRAIAQHWKSADQQLFDGITMASHLPTDRPNQVQ
jgi:hypothetical protein